MDNETGKNIALHEHWVMNSAEDINDEPIPLLEAIIELLEEGKRGRKKKKKRKASKKRKKKKSGKKDACYYKVRSRYSVWPSAYASGALVKCRKVGAKNWGNSTKEGVFRENLLLSALIDDIVDHAIDVIEEKRKKKRKKKRKLTQKPSSETNLRDWFKRKGAKGKKGGWVDCNTCRKNKKTGRKKCKPCGRTKGEKRSKYPSCRPTPGACSQKGKGKKWGKKK